MLHKIKSSGRVLTALSALITLSACGGGSSGSDSGSDNTVTLQAGAFVTETVFEDASSSEGITYLSPTGKFASAFGTDDITFGSISFDGASINGSGTDYVLFDTWELTPGTLSGTVNSNETASLTASAEGFTSNTTLQRENSYSDLGVTLEEVSGTYTMSQTGFFVTSVTIGSNGAVTGSDETGCVFNGTLTIPLCQPSCPIGDFA